MRFQLMCLIFLRVLSGSYRTRKREVWGIIESLQYRYTTASIMGFGDFFSDAWNGIKDTAGSVFNGVKSAGEGVFNSVLKPVYNGVLKPVGEGVYNNVLKPVGEKALGLGQNLWNRVDRIQNLGDHVIDAGGKVIDGAGNAAVGIGDFLGGKSNILLYIALIAGAAIVLPKVLDRI